MHKRRFWFVVGLAAVIHFLWAGPRWLAAQGKADRPEFETRYEPGRVVRRDPAGRTLWLADLGGRLGRLRDPHLLTDADRVYLTHDDGITALNKQTGKVVWHAKGPSDRLFLNGGLLLAAECDNGDHIVTRGRWLVARAVATGRESFRVRLPDIDFDPQPIREVAGLFLVQDGSVWSGKAALLIDRRGRVRHRLVREVVAGVHQDKDSVFVTHKEIVRLAPNSKVVWSVPWDEEQGPPGGGLLRLPGGDLIAFCYGMISDSGVQVVRLDPARGVVRWRASCAPLGVRHSKYRHRATVTVTAGGQLKVVSRGSFGTFTEILDLGTGRQRSRQKQDGSP
jgi:hypothetical protein